MIDPGKAVKQSTEKRAETPVASASKLITGAVFGLAFGFLLQKGGVGKFNILIGQLLLQDFTVAKIMLTAIVVGMVGVCALHHFAKVNLHIKPTNWIERHRRIVLRCRFCTYRLLPRHGCRRDWARKLGRTIWDGGIGRRVLDIR